jgi:glycosyltransferase involved in cell wall biosynthesis
MQFSIIIPTLNEEVLLPNLLRDLQAQTFRDFEVIVADAGSKDGTVDLAQSLGARVVPGGMPAVGRNRGAQAAGGDFLVFLDADTRVAPTFLEQIHAELEERFLDLATCEIKTHLPKSAGWPAARLHQPGHQNRSICRPTRARFLHHHLAAAV